MAKLTEKQRNRLKSNQFALGDKYPINDIAHAWNALARASQMLKAGKLTQAQYDQIVAKVHRKFPQIGKAKKAAMARRAEK